MRKREKKSMQHSGTGHMWVDTADDDLIIGLCLGFVEQ